jgi:hypothetical protein
MICYRYKEFGLESLLKPFLETRYKLSIPIRNDGLRTTLIVQQELPAENIALVFGCILLVA